MNVTTFSSVRVLFAFLSAGISSFGAAVTTAAPTIKISPENLQFFENKVRPILAANCAECHSQTKGKVKGGLNMDTREDMLKGGSNGPIFKPGDIKEGSFVAAIDWSDDLQMPPKTQLNKSDIATLKEWISRGAPDPREGSTGPKVTPKDHWAFHPVQRPALPAVKNEAWCKNSIDRFILAKLEEKGLTPAYLPNQGPPEERRYNKEALLRRACFDLVGLPPNMEQLKVFVDDESPNAYERVVDALMASPSYGERWARHWMDTVRYSDTTGYDKVSTGDAYRYPYAWTYRDWVISALNKDMPYDKFIINQLAADKVPKNAPANLAALGFLTLGQKFQDKDSVINDRIDVVGRGFLGLTLACARCHAHKFDPITQADYYSLHGIFSSVQEPKEFPIIGFAGKHEDIKKFNSDLAALEDGICTKYYTWLHEETAKFRSEAAGYLEVALSSNRLTSNQDVIKRASELVTSLKLDIGLIRYMQERVFIGNASSPIKSLTRNSVAYPFHILVSVTGAERDAVLAKLLSGQSRFPSNLVVLDFLKRAGPLPSDPKLVSALFEKLITEKLPAYLMATSWKAPDKGDLYKKIEDPKFAPNPQERALMELAVFPFPLVLRSEMNEEKLQDYVSHMQPPIKVLEKILDLPQISAFKMHASAQPVRAMIVEDLPKPVNSPVYPRGVRPAREDEKVGVPHRFLECLSPNSPPAPFKEGSGRLELAEAIANKNNPLTARVLVNRMWMYHFGEGLVRTPDDLGNNAGTPTHPELLDFLTSWFMQDFGTSKPGWSMKALHKAIMMSSTYQQSCRSNDMQKQLAIDSDNSLLWHSNIRRLDFESFRDSLLSMANALDYTMGGPPINLVSEPYSYRRSIYGYIDRANMADLLMQFDMPNPNEPNTKRASSIVPQQALFLMNSPFALSLVKKVAQRPDIDAVKHDTNAAIGAVFRVVLQRTPSAAEFKMTSEFLKGQSSIQEKVVKSMTGVATKASQEAESEVKRMQIAEVTSTTSAIINKGSVVQLTPLTPLETLIQALMYSNSAAYLR